MTQTAVSRKSLPHAKRQAKTPDIGALLKRHGSWYGSAKTPIEAQWLISFWNGMLLVDQDTQVDHNTPDETTQARMIGSWQMWTTAEVQSLSFTGTYQTVQDGPIRLRQLQTEGTRFVYLMETLCAYLPKADWSFWYLPAKQSVLVKDQDGQPRAVFTEFVPQIPIRPIERNKGKK